MGSGDYHNHSLRYTRRPRSRSPENHHSYRRRRSPSRTDRFSHPRNGRSYRSPEANFPKTHRHYEISPERERSRARERARRKAQAECIRKAGGLKKLAESEGHDPISLFWDGFQWVEKTGPTNGPQNDPAFMNSTRKLRRLYFGNLPIHTGLTESSFQNIVWQEMKARNFCNNIDYNPVIYVWFARERGNYGFVEFATVEETERALTMDGMMCNGIPLKVSRPNDYSTASVTQNQVMAQIGQHAAAMLMGNPSSPATSTPPPPPGPPPGLPPNSTKFLKLPQVVLENEVEDDEEFEEILEDVLQAFHPHGEIVRAHIITPKDCTTEKLVGDIFIELATTQMVEDCISKNVGRKYLNRPIVLIRSESYCE